MEKINKNGRTRVTVHVSGYVVRSVAPDCIQTQRDYINSLLGDQKMANRASNYFQTFQTMRAVAINGIPANVISDFM